MSDGYKVYASQDYVDKKAIKTISGVHNIADLEEGTYTVKMGAEDPLTTKIILSNVDQLTEDYKEDYCYSYGGLLTISEKIIEETEEKISSTILFNTNGFIAGPALLSIWDDVDADGSPTHSEEYTSFDNPLDLTGFVLCEKFKTEAPEGKEIDKWYCNFGDWLPPFSSVPVTAVRDTVYKEQPDYRLRTQIPSSLAVKKYVENTKNITSITEPTHIADLDEGVYIIKGPYSPSNGETTNGYVTIENLESGSKIVDDYTVIANGILIITNKTLEEYDEQQEVTLDFIATGMISGHGHIIESEVTGEGGELNIVEDIGMINNPTTLNGVGLQAMKFNTTEAAEVFEGAVLDTWYSSCYYKFSDVSADSLVENIGANPSRFEIPTVLAVKKYISTIKTELQGDLDSVSALIGGTE